jgi:3-phosphoshikimate 1-carboxyvinyltransferase
MAAEQLRVEPARALVGHIAVPDFGTAAPFVVAASLLSGSELTVHEVGLDPKRSRLLDVLGRMGARIAVFNRRRSAKPLGDLEVRSTELVAATVPEDETNVLLDDLPLLGLAAGSARGDSRIRGIDHLGPEQQEWVETVRISLRALGIRAQKRDDELGVRGVPTRPKGGGMDPRGDPRLAVMGVIAGLVSREGVVLQDPELVAVSFPGFFELLESVTQR